MNEKFYSKNPQMRGINNFKCMNSLCKYNRAFLSLSGKKYQITLDENSPGFRVVPLRLVLAPKGVGSPGK
jgi:hypothetical protein